MVNLRTIEHYSTFEKGQESQNRAQIEEVIGNGANLSGNDGVNISTINQN
jgi:hypothetical protein